jgi:hypothetical protein
MLSDLWMQLRSIWLIIVSPRKALLSLPSDRLWLTAFIISSYFTLARFLRQGWVAGLESAVGSTWIALAVLLFLSFLAFCVAGAFLHVLIRILGKKLSLRKVLNILGYSQAPRFVLSVPASVAIAILPADLRNLPYGSVGSAVGIALTCIGVPVFLYSFILMIWGFIITPDERRVEAAEESAA